ncbi:hypothetical protein MSG28_010670 [Choristoneura fumiferana]|uniref:Uncharacterized protein n=1 Tax=Choristoneura fumiferana TaxID=7141 RepID=A0ACC0KNG7_CHOFU|nr:hypothetical protein MSG28_010670 [Choristoneura fumiferana]
MNFLSNLYEQSLAKNEEALRFWENYLQNLKSLDFSLYANKLKVPALIPIGSKILFRGEVKHTNEVTVALDAESKVEALHKERDFIHNRFSFSKENVFKDEGQEIFEEFTEEEDLKWREQHKKNMREYKQQSKTNEPEDKITDEELWYRLEELELKEELEEEMENMGYVPDKLRKVLHSNKNKRKSEPQEIHTKKDDTSSHQEKKIETQEDNNKTNELSLLKKTQVQNCTETEPPRHDSKLDLLQQVIHKQNELKEKLNDLKNKEIAPSVTEKDLMKRLDEMDELDELEDEMDRLDDVLQNEDVEESEEVEENLIAPAVNIKRSVSFADEDDSETLEVEFNHSDMNPDTTPYDKANGIMKPSDIYAAFADLFTETTSILKKSKYESELAPSGPRVEKRTKVVDFQEAEDNRKMNKTISVNDVVEKVDENDNTCDSSEKRPMSLFKKRRQQNRR